MDVTLALLLLATGLIAGLVGGLLGIGGCSIMLPILIFVYGYPEPIAIGTTITAVVLTALSGAIAHIRMRNVDKRTAIAVGAGGSVGAAVGDIIFNMLSKQMWALDLVLGLAFIYAAIRMFWEGLAAGYRRLRTGATPAKPEAEQLGGTVPGSIPSKVILGFVVGIITGIVGLGGGYVLVPAFIYILHSAVKIAVGTSLASFLPLAIVSAAPKLLAGYVNVIAAVLLGIGTIIGAQIGARLVPKTPGWLIKLLFGIFFLVVSIKFILKGLAHFI